MADPAITELDELGAEKVSGVGSPANGTEWLLLKSRDVQADPESPHTSSPEADEQEDEMTKAEADEIENLLTKANYCGEESCELCEKVILSLPPVLIQKARLKAKQRAALPGSAFALSGRRFPIHDENHARAALAEQGHATPEEQATIRRKVKARYPGIEVSEKSTGVPAESVATPKEKGHLATGQSGLAGPMTAGLRPDHDDPSFTHGGESSYHIPEESKINDNPPAPAPMDRPGEGSVVTQKDTWEIEVIEKQNWISLDDPQSGVGSPQWEHYDAAALDSAATGIAAAGRAVEMVRQREITEAQHGDQSDWIDAEKLDCAGEHLCMALELVAALAYHEGSEASKEAVRKTLAAYGGEVNPTNAGNGSSPSEEEIDMATVTKEELQAEIKATSDAAVKEALKAERKLQKAKAKKAAQKAKKKAKKMPPWMTQKNANNGGDISAETMAGAVHGQHDANDVNAVPDGGHVDGEYINKTTKKGDKKLRKAIEANNELMTKALARPRTGGPVLDGQARAGAFPAAEGRTTEAVTKSGADGEIERLEKALEGAGDAMTRDQVSRELTLARLRQGHESGQI